MEVFISHSSLEAPLANWLNAWIKQNVPNTQAFCSSIPDDLPPGDDWFQEIVERARKADRCLILLSPESLDKHWLYFEAGLTLGAAPTHKLVPVLYGGLGTTGLPGPLRHRQALVIDERDSFNAFVNQTLAAAGPDRWYDEFQREMSPSVERLIKYGLYGGFFGDCEIEIKNDLVLQVNPEREGFYTVLRTMAKYGNPGQIVALRATVVPRRRGFIEHWKFGVQLTRSWQTGTAGRVFELHSGLHDGRSSWSIYDDPQQIIAFNFPAFLEQEREHRLEIWLSGDHRFVTCVGIDCQGERVCFRNGHGEIRWRLADYDWDEIRVKAWGDQHAVRVDVEELEIHRVRVTA